MIEELMRTRRSVRRYRDEAPSRALIERVLDSAVTAPSASNRQPWRFHVITDRRVVDEMAAAVADRVGQLEAHVTPALLDRFREYGDYFTRFTEAPVVIALLYRPTFTMLHTLGDQLPEDERDELRLVETDSALFSTALAAQNLMLAAHALGLGSSCMTGPLFAREALHRILSLPTALRIAALLPIGFPAEVPASPGRKTAERVTKWVVGPEQPEEQAT